ncbi:MAG: 4Fe-4S dicluster domain-containing protein [Actinomycetota bacterium]|nr:4Fe-4S dicluster domain-containing protein [Actinomycetota bacterium]MDD5665720.1 4Fe-4S dicluster domain-containing protein [Actinomycetota bacterium]
MAGFKIRVTDCDAEACGNRCQEACPQGVFLAVPRDKDRARHGADPRYRIVPRFASFCDGCGECLSVCGQDAIRIVFRATGEAIAQAVAPGG